MRLKIRGAKKYGEDKSITDVSTVKEFCAVYHYKVWRGRKAGSCQTNIPFLETELTQEQLPVWDWPNDFISFSV